MIPIDTGHDQREAYVAHFAPWENEQLACIQDYLLQSHHTRFELPLFYYMNCLAKLLPSADSPI